MTDPSEATARQRAAARRLALESDYRQADADRRRALERLRKIDPEAAAKLETPAPPADEQT